MEDIHSDAASLRPRLLLYYIQNFDFLFFWNVFHAYRKPFDCVFANLIL